METQASNLEKLATDKLLEQIEAGIEKTIILCLYLFVMKAYIISEPAGPEKLISKEISVPHVNPG
jgi:hypothetical protein